MFFICSRCSLGFIFLLYFFFVFLLGPFMHDILFYLCECVFAGESAEMFMRLGNRQELWLHIGT